jgi:tetratricopeptide (TPR) repeat protein/TolB-like protein
MALTPGSKLGFYSILDRLGSGGMGEVHRAHDNRLGREVAVKALPDEFSRDPVRVLRFEREARMLAALNHPAVAAIYGLEEADGEKFIVMELVPGETLSEKVAHGSLTLDESLKIARQIAEALEAAHERGIIHRDLKPANVKVTPEGRVKVLDLGLAKAFDVKETGSSDPGSSLSPTLVIEGTQPGVILGTAEFMSPEQARGKPVDKRTDIWAFGCVLYELLTGLRTFTGETATDVLAAIVTKEPAWEALPVDTPPRIRELLVRCLQKDPNRRLRDIGDARIEIEETLADRRTRSASGSVSAPVSAPVIVAPARSPRIRRGFVAALAGAAVLAVFLLLRARGGAPAAAPPPAATRFLAVLPFKDLSGQADGQLLGDAFAETMSARLSRVPGLQVVTPRATTDFSAGENDLSEVARSTGATLFVGGAIQRAGDRVRITCSLRAPDGVQLHGDEVTAPAADIFGAQDRLAETVLGWLGAKRPTRTTPRPDTALESPEAQESYLKAIGALRRYDSADSIATAVRILTDLDRERPGSPLILAALGRAYLHEFEITRDPASAERAIAACEAARALDEANPEVHTTLGQILSLTGKPAEAALELERALAEQPSSIDALLALGAAYRSAGRASEAEATYQRAIARQPNYWAAYNQTGSFYYRVGRYPEAIGMFQEALKRRPDSTRIWNNLGAAYFKTDRYADARKAYASSLRIEPSDGAYSTLGTIEYFLGNYRAAAAAYEQAAKLTPGKYLYWANLADAYRWVPDAGPRAAPAYEKAIGLARREIALNPRNAAAHATLAVCLAKTGDPKGAGTHIEKALEIEPRNPDHFLYAAIVANLAGRSADAIGWIRRGVAAGLGVAQIEKEPEFANLRTLPAFREALGPPRKAA